MSKSELSDIQGVGHIQRPLIHTYIFTYRQFTVELQIILTCKYLDCGSEPKHPRFAQHAAPLA